MQVTEKSLLVLLASSIEPVGLCYNAGCARSHQYRRLLAEWGQLVLLLLRVLINNSVHVISSSFTFGLKTPKPAIKTEIIIVINTGMNMCQNQ